MFEKGKSGNPSGRPKHLGAISAIAREHTQAAIDTLVAALKADNERTRVAAAEALLDRGWGKATQAFTGQIEHSGQVAYIAAPLPETLSWLEGDAGGDQERPLTEPLH